MKICKSFLIMMAILLMVPIIGCSEGTDEEDGMSASEVIARAVAAAGELQSFRSESIVTYTSEEQETTRWISGERFASPDRYHGYSNSGDEWSEFIMIGDAQYVRHWRNPEWRKSGESYEENGAVTTFTVSRQDDSQLLNSLTDLEMLSEEEINGIGCFHYRGKVDTDAMMKRRKAEMERIIESPPPEYEESLAMMRRWECTVDLWIGKDDYLIRQQRSDARTPRFISDDEEVWDTLITLTTYYDFNAPITIEPPENAKAIGVVPAPPQKVPSNE